MPCVCPMHRHAPALPEGTIAELAQALNAGQVQNLIIVGGNPAYNAPADLDWRALQETVGEVIRVGYYAD